MAQSRTLTAAIRSSLLFGTTALGCFAVPAVFAQETPAQAQARASEGQPKTLDKVEVTGSRIKKVDVEGSAPVFTMSREEFQQRGITSVGDAVQQLTNSFNGNSRMYNTGGGSAGEIHANLRNFGLYRTLVVVNGRRWVGGGSLSSQIDLGAIPTAAVKRIEVLKDGGSVLYGADAMVGVINIILEEEFDGTEFNSYYGINEHGDGATTNADITFGSSGERGGWLAGFDYAKYDPIFARDREISREVTYRAGWVRHSDITPAGRFQLCDATIAPGASCSASALGLPDGSAGAFTYAPGSAGTDWRLYQEQTDRYNPKDEAYLSIPYERAAVFGSAHFDITDKLRFKAFAQYNDRTSNERERPQTLDLGAGGTESALNIPVTSYYNPWGIWHTEPGQARAIGKVQRQLDELGPRIAARTAVTASISARLEGEFALGEKVFDWEAGTVHGRTDIDGLLTGRVSRSRLEQALGPSFLDPATGQVRCGTPGNVIEGCVPIDLIGEGSVTPEMARYIGIDETEERGYRMTQNFAQISSSDLFKLPGGPFGFAAGVEYRREWGFFDPAPERLSGDSLSGQQGPTRGEISVKEAYLETSWPLLADLPFVKLFDVTVAGRFSRYQNGQETTNGKFGFKWQFNDELMLRGNYSTGFRSPTISNYFEPVVTTQSTSLSANDPCSFTTNAQGQMLSNRYGALTPEQQALCQAQGVTAGGYDSRTAAPAQHQRGGNPDLAPETNVYKTLGVVYSPNWVPGLDVALDWYWVKFKDGILPTGEAFGLTDCFGEEQGTGFFGNPGASPNCGTFRRDPATGALTYVRSYQSQNSGSGSEQEGYDLTVYYRLSDTPMGDWRFTWDTSYSSKFNPSGGPPVIGTYSGQNSRWRIRSNLGVNWSRDNIGATWYVRYYDALDEPCGLIGTPAVYLCNKLGPIQAGQDTPDPIDDSFLPAQGGGGENRLPSKIYNDVSVWANTPWKAKVTFGVQNVFNQSPPISTRTDTTNSFPAIYGAPGRFFYVSYNQKF